VAEYSYDKLSQLTNVDYAVEDPYGQQDENHAYDGAGNRLDGAIGADNLIANTHPFDGPIYEYDGNG
jgi:hypothetical protein